MAENRSGAHVLDEVIEHRVTTPQELRRSCVLTRELPISMCGRRLDSDHISAGGGSQLEVLSGECETARGVLARTAEELGAMIEERGAMAG